MRLLRRLSPPADPWSETEWQRARRTFWDLVGGGKMSLTFAVVTLLVAAAAAYVAQSTNLHALPTAAWTVGSGLVTIVLLSVGTFGVAWCRTLRRQRDEARDEVERLRRLAKLEFPDHDLEIKAPWYGDFPDPRDPGRTLRLLFLGIRYTNRQRDRSVSLQLDLIWRRGDLTGRINYSSLASDLSDVLDLPLQIDPDRTAQGDLAFEPYESWVFEYGDLTEVWVKDNYAISLCLTDHVTGMTLEQAVPERSRKSVD